MTTLNPAGQPAKSPPFISQIQPPLPGVTNPWADLPVNEPCVAPFGQLHCSYHTFRGWDFVDWEISNDYRWGADPKAPEPDIEIFCWRFMDSDYWHGELCPIPVGTLIIVHWGHNV